MNMQYLHTSDISDVIRLRRETGFMLLAGGTDVYPAIEGGLRIPGLIDVSRVAALRGPIELRDGVWNIPALSTWTEIVEAELPAQFDLLKQAALEIGGRQIQNVGTIGGNICNASPAADGIVALLALNARLVLSGPSGERETALDAFVFGNRHIDLREGEVLRAIRVIDSPGRHASAFKKLGARRYLVISIVMVGAFLQCDRNKIVQEAAIAVGSCAGRAVRLPQWERHLIGRAVAEVPNILVDTLALTPLSPVDDIRGSSNYRLHAAKILVCEALRQISEGLL